ncbi:MAG TPA: hypothetical protein VN364_00440 [Bellilinea sp.]|nr:hypothetical protein [Bellilinea sp.]
MLDFTIYTYNLVAGKADPQLPGLFTGLPPRKAARGREHDRLVLHLSFDGSNPLPAETQREFLEKLTALFFNTPGTVTYALKLIVAQLNDRLLARNLRSREGTTAIGLFQALVLHDDSLFIAQSGPIHTFIFTRDGVNHYYETEDGGYGLGTSRIGAVRFYRENLKLGDQVLLSARPPAHWLTAALTGLSRLPLDQQRAVLTGPNPSNLSFLLLQTDRGKGLLPIASLHEVASRPLTAAAVPMVDQTPPPAVPPPPPVFLSGETLETDESQNSTLIGDSGEKVVGLFAGLLASRKKAETAPEVPQSEPEVLPPTDIEASAEVPDLETFISPPINPPTVEPWSPDRGEPDFAAQSVSAEAEVPAVGTSRIKTSRRTRTALVSGLRGWRAFKNRVGSGFSTLLSRIMPGQAEKMPTVAPGVLVFIAIAVPLIIVAVATTVYLQNGRGEQHKALMAQSLAAVTQAQAQSDPVLQRVTYEAALDWVRQAEDFGVTDESRTLKAQISSAIDAMDGISRFELHPALSSDFDRGVRISQIWASPTEDLYLLDTANGRVLRMVFTRPGYEIDPLFSCGPGMVGSLIIGPLVDIVLAPTGNAFDSVVLGVDATGNLLYCSLNAGKTTAVTLPPPDAGWGKIQAITYQNSVLSVLDPGGNAVWRYEGFGLDFSAKPRLFFDNIVPNLAGAIDLAVYLDDLFVLNQDGHMLVCTYSNVEVTPTRCTDPYPYRVSAAGQAPQESVTLNAQFTQIQATQPPEPSLFYLDASGRAVYQFSMSLNFVRRLQPTTDGDNPLPDSAPTALAVTGGRNLVMAYDNRIFIAAMPAP